jgi:hypothetical protein
MSSTDDGQLAQTARMYKALWLFFLASPVLYIVIAWFLLQGRSEAHVEPSYLGTIRILFLVVAVASYFASFRIQRLLISRWLAGSDPPEAGLFTALLVGWSMLEAIAILGLVLVILGSVLRDVVVFALVALLGLLRMRPVSQQWIQEALRARSQH